MASYLQVPRNLGRLLLFVLAVTAVLMIHPQGANADDIKDCAKRDPLVSIKACTALIKRNPKNTVALFNRGYAHYKKNEFDRAIADYDQTIKLNPKVASVFFLRGIVYRAKKEFDLAIADYDQAIKLNPKYAEAYNNRCWALFNVNRLQAALSDCNRSLELRSDDAATLDSRGNVLLAMGRLEEALVDAKRAIELKPGETYPRELLEKVEAAIVSRNAAETKMVVTKQQEAPRVTSSVGATPGKRLALVIGNGAYQHATALPNPTNDARAMTAMLGGMGFEVLSGVDLDLNAMNVLLRDFSRKASDSDIALLFYAGHGMQVGSRNYLVPIDAKLGDPTAVDFELVEVNESVVKYLGGGDRIGIVILDACRDNPLSRSLARTFGTTRSGELKQGLAEIRTAGGVLVAFATAPGDVAADGDSRNSPFTQALLKHLPTPGMEFERVLKRVKSEVYQTTRQKQEPWSNSALRSDLFLVGQ